MSRLSVGDYIIIAGAGLCGVVASIVVKLCAEKICDSMCRAVCDVVKTVYSDKE